MVAFAFLRPLFVGWLLPGGAGRALLRCIGHWPPSNIAKLKKLPSRKTLVAISPVALSRVQLNDQLTEAAPHVVHVHNIEHRKESDILSSPGAIFGCT